MSQPIIVIKNEQINILEKPMQTNINPDKEPTSLNKTIPHIPRLHKIRLKLDPNSHAKRSQLNMEILHILHKNVRYFPRHITIISLIT